MVRLNDLSLLVQNRYGITRVLHSHSLMSVYMYYLFFLLLPSSGI